MGKSFTSEVKKKQIMFITNMSITDKVDIQQLKREVDILSLRRNLLDKCDNWEEYKKLTKARYEVLQKISELEKQ
jgi:hypothetical protein